MPTLPVHLPGRGCFGDDRKRSAKMKQVIVTS
jgi:hypothetical protein